MVPPVPIPNTVVKHSEAESTCLVTGWEDRKLLVEVQSTRKCGCFFRYISPLLEGGRARRAGGVPCTVFQFRVKVFRGCDKEFRGNEPAAATAAAGRAEWPAADGASSRWLDAPGPAARRFDASGAAAERAGSERPAGAAAAGSTGPAAGEVSVGAHGGESGRWYAGNAFWRNI